jgi:hypothetical protein
VGGLLESAHAILAGLDPANEIAFGLAFGKLWSVHLNDQNGYGKNGEYVGLEMYVMELLMQG